MWWLTLAQVPEDADKSVGLLERVIAGGVPLICLVVAVIAVIAAVLQYRKNADLEASYRADLDARAKKADADAEKRLADAKTEADKARDREMGMMKERLASEKESDATLAAAVRMIDKCAGVLERVERKIG
jgi:hypothetical protein